MKQQTLAGDAIPVKQAKSGRSKASEHPLKPSMVYCQEKDQYLLTGTAWNEADCDCCEPPTPEELDQYSRAGLLGSSTR